MTDGRGPTDQATWMCPRCGFPVYAVNRFCGGCALPLPPDPTGTRPEFATMPKRREPKKTCPWCKRPALPNRSFCTWCGCDVRGVPVRPQPKPVRPPEPADPYDMAKLSHAAQPAATLLVFFALQVLVLIALHALDRHQGGLVNDIFNGSLYAIGVANLVAIVGMTIQAISLSRADRKAKRRALAASAAGDPTQRAPGDPVPGTPSWPPPGTPNRPPP